ncbi:C-4 sterol methyl oxidase [Chytriomyces hyalinus]|nr:C-4 sterol methyl oxidase [Chytriomyces hyalinus]
MLNLTTLSTNAVKPVIPDGYSPNALEQLWFNIFSGDMNPTIKLALILFAWHEFVFYSRFFPYLILDQIPYFRQYKIQADKQVSNETLLKVTRHVSISQITTQLPMMILFKPIVETLGMRFLEAPFPSVPLIVLQNVFFMLAEDTYHYWGHRALHWGWLYKNIHKQHHEYQATFGIAAEYASVAEVLILGIGFFIGPVIWSLFSMGAWVAGDACDAGGMLQWVLGGCGGHYASSQYSLHVFTVFMWLALRLVLTVDNHCGYDFPWSIRHFFPVWAGADWHDYHHLAFIGNYGSTFRYWDWICGTDVGYIKHTAKKAEMLQRSGGEKKTN